MQTSNDKKRWFSRQSFFTKMMLLAAIFFVTSAVTDYLFEGKWFFQGQKTGVLQQIIIQLLKPLAFGAVFAFWSRDERKKPIEK